MEPEFSGRSVVVTGAGRGIGRAIAESFAAAGARVVVGARTPSYGEEAVAAIRTAGGEASLCLLDVTDRAAVEALVAEAVARHGGLDVVVHSASEVPFGGLDASDADIERALASIIKASFWLARAARPHLRAARGGGRMIFISSVAGRRTVTPGLGAYCVAKAGLEAFIRSTALELARENITVNGVEPGMIASARQLQAMGADAVRAIGAASPVGRAGTPQDVARIALFLASPGSSFITGASILADGGLTLSTLDPSAAGADHRRQDLA